MKVLQMRTELSLVVGDTAWVQPFAVHRGLERLALPELERRRRLHVEMPVDEDRRHVAVRARRRDLADHERLRVGLLEVRLAAGAAHEVAYPLGGRSYVRRVEAIRADAGDAH